MDLYSMWSYQESFDELKQKIIYKTLELQQVQKQANEEMVKKEEQIIHLLRLLQIAYQERDEARGQIQKILKKVTPKTQLESPLVIPGKAKPSIMESNSILESYNHHSHGSSPIGSFVEAVTSPDISNINLGDSTSTCFGNQQDYNFSALENLVNATGSRSLVYSEEPKIDPASAIIEDLAKGRSLPQKGRLLQGVLESGPLIQTLLVAGPLPRWRNPPTRSGKTSPPVTIKGPENLTMNQKPGADQVHWTWTQENSLPAYYDVSRVSPHMCLASISNLSSDNYLALGIGLNYPIPSNKRQRLQ